MLETAKIASSISSNHLNIEQDANIRFTRSFRRKQINSYISPSNSTNPDYILIPSTISNDMSTIFDARVKSLDAEYQKAAIRFIRKQKRKDKVRKDLYEYCNDTNASERIRVNYTNITKTKSSSNKDSSYTQEDPPSLSPKVDLNSLDPMYKDPNEALTMKVPNSLFEAFMSKKNVYSGIKHG